MNLTRTHFLHLTELKNKLLTKITLPISKDIIIKMHDDLLLGNLFPTLKTDLSPELFEKKNDVFQDNSMSDCSFDDIKCFANSEVLNPILYQNKKIFIETLFEKIKKFILEVNLKKRLNYNKGKDFLNENFKRFGFEVL